MGTTAASSDDGEALSFIALGSTVDGGSALSVCIIVVDPPADVGVSDCDPPPQGTLDVILCSRTLPVTMSDPG